MVIASREESAPLVSLEAMVVGIPIVSSAIDGLVEQLENEKTALLFEKGDSQTLSSCLLRVVEDSALRETLALNAKKVCREAFDLRKIKELYGNEFTRMDQIA